MLEGILLCILTLIAAFVGTATGFGLSTIMIPVVTLFAPMPIALLFVGTIHLCGNIWKVILFKSGIDKKLVLGFGIAGIIASFIGASLSMNIDDAPLKRILAIFLLFYVVFLSTKRKWALKTNNKTAIAGGLLSGLCAGFFGVGGAVRGAFLTAYNLPKPVYIFTSGLIALFIDVTRVSRYLWAGTRLEQDLLIALCCCIPVSFISARIAKKFIDKLPQKFFRIFISVFLTLVAIKMLVWG
ncbi:hypothetical protein BVX97_02770 [bacterium E08(2017)]|nr:hypothetical protein BVX97_02770 [bacterium E08(2017)]